MFGRPHGKGSNTSFIATDVIQIQHGPDPECPVPGSPSKASYGELGRGAESLKLAERRWCAFVVG
jgi:hypothetical protein